MTTLVESQQKGISATSYNASQEKYALFKECHDQAFSCWSPFLEEAAKDHRFVLGDQWDARERDFLQRQGRNALVFNRVRRNIKMVSGYERKSRHSLISMPVENGDDETASLLTASMLWASQFDNMAHTMSDAFESSLKTGINLLEPSLDFVSDPINGDIRLNRIPYNAFLLDPRFTKRDLSDCEYLMHRRLLSHAAAKKLLPFRSKEIDGIRPKGADGQFSNMANTGYAKKLAPLKYDEFWLRSTKQVKCLVDMQTGDIQEFDPKNVDLERVEYFASQFPHIQVIDKTVGTVELNVFVEGNLLFEGEDPWSIRDFPHVPVMAFWDPEYTSNNSHFSGGPIGENDYSTFFRSGYGGDYALKLQSLVRPTRDPATEANRRRSKMLDIIDSQINTGWQAMENSVVNPRDMYQSGQGKVVWMKKGSQLGDAVKIQPPDIPNGLFNLSEMMDRDVVEIAGITDELLGMQEGDSNKQMSGVLAAMRQGAGLTVLQDLLDNFRLSQKILGGKLQRMIQNNWGPEKIQRITGKQVTEEFMDGNFAKYDVVVEEALETTTQRSLAYAQLMQAREVGVAIPDSVLIDYMPITDKSSLKEAVEAANEEQKRVQEEQLEDQARYRELQRAKVFSDIGLGVERIARAEADRGLAAERQSEFSENMAQAALARAKAVREIEGMDIDNLLRLISFMRDQETADRAIGEAQVQQKRAETEQEFGGLVSALQLPGVSGLLGSADQNPNNL